MQGKSLPQGPRQAAKPLSASGLAQFTSRPATTWEKHPRLQLKSFSLPVSCPGAFVCFCLRVSQRGNFLAYPPARSLLPASHSCFLVLRLLLLQLHHLLPCCCSAAPPPWEGAMKPVGAKTHRVQRRELPTPPFPPGVLSPILPHPAPSWWQPHCKAAEGCLMEGQGAPGSSPRYSTPSLPPAREREMRASPAHITPSFEERE